MGLFRDDSPLTQRPRQQPTTQNVDGGGGGGLFTGSELAVTAETPQGIVGPVGPQGPEGPAGPTGPVVFLSLIHI